MLAVSKRICCNSKTLLLIDMNELFSSMQAMNQAGLARMCRMLAVLQPFLAGLGATMSLFRPEAARHLEKARAYYAHLTYSPQALIAAALSKPTRFTAKEYLALLEASLHQLPFSATLQYFTQNITHITE